MSKENELIQLDIELLEGYLQSLGHSTVKKMFALYEQQVVLYLNNINDSFLTDNQQLWEEHCHKMKGAAGSVGLKALHARLKNMEKMTTNKSDKAQQFAELTKHNTIAMEAFANWLNNK